MADPTQDAPVQDTPVQDARPDEAEIRVFVERFAASLIDTGVPPMPARVMARMLVADQGTMTAADLAAALRVSQPAISGAVRFLNQIGFLRKERMPGSRKDHYRIRDDAWFLVLAQRNRALAEWVASARDGADMFGGASTEVGGRLAVAADFFQFIQEDLDEMMSRWHARNPRGHRHHRVGRNPASRPVGQP